MQLVKLSPKVQTKLQSLQPAEKGQKGVLMQNFMAEIACEINSCAHVYHLPNLNSEYSFEVCVPSPARRPKLTPLLVVALFSSRYCVTFEGLSKALVQH